MNLDDKSVVYCDANFLVTYSIKNPQEPDLQKQAKILFMNLLAAKCRIAISPLAFDEAWNGIRKAVGVNKDNAKFFGFLNNNMQLSYPDVLGELEVFTKNILKHKNVAVVQLVDSSEGVINALGKLNVLKPRDAFHLVMALDNGSSHMITNDGKLKIEAEKSGIACLDFDKS
jgi:predicted nucleic acid-binding protein